MATGKVKAGDVFNNWTVLNEDRRNRGVQHFMCKCVCGTTRVVRKDNLGLVQGCGCERKTYKARTGETKPRTKKARIVSPKPVSTPKKYHITKTKSHGRNTSSAANQTAS
tara:strand:+ start:2769 stop:3098 length:330 start_codon:yes stop_codon:yes gene_type:complete